MGAALSRDKLLQAFESLGRDLSDRGKFIELAVYGGSAIMLQVEWRRSTEDIDAIVRESFDEHGPPSADARMRFAAVLGP